MNAVAEIEPRLQTGAQVLQVSDLRVELSAQVDVLSGVSFTVAAGEILGLVGSLAPARPPWPRRCSRTPGVGRELSAAGSKSPGRRCWNCAVKTCAGREAA